jgi:hypothetical protein
LLNPEADLPWINLATKTRNEGAFSLIEVDRWAATLSAAERQNIGIKRRAQENEVYLVLKA